ncbi:hypothetical protein [Micromonospora sp. NPDC005806]|uniref:hypothetical protein n=1 Tax=Micromonospora sp. NPDC005806 TaxID=3364234 RepID=UPI003687FC13
MREPRRGRQPPAGGPAGPVVRQAGPHRDATRRPLPAGPEGESALPGATTPGPDGAEAVPAVRVRPRRPAATSVQAGRAVVGLDPADVVRLRRAVATGFLDRALRRGR